MVRKPLVQMAWRWVRDHLESALTRWYLNNVSARDCGSDPEIVDRVVAMRNAGDDSHRRDAVGNIRRVNEHPNTQVA